MAPRVRVHHLAAGGAADLVQLQEGLLADIHGAALTQLEGGLMVGGERQGKGGGGSDAQKQNMHRRNQSRNSLQDQHVSVPSVSAAPLGWLATQGSLQPPPHLDDAVEYVVKEFYGEVGVLVDTAQVAAEGLEGHLVLHLREGAEEGVRGRTEGAKNRVGGIWPAWHARVAGD